MMMIIVVLIILVFIKYLCFISAIRERCGNWRDYLFKCLSGAKTFSAEFLQQLQSQPYNRFQKGMKVEVADRKNMYSMCVATIVDVIGDRLRMRYDGLDDDVAEDFWCHYQSSEIHPIGWSSLVGHTLQPPIGKCKVDRNTWIY